MLIDHPQHPVESRRHLLSALFHELVCSCDGPGFVVLATPARERWAGSYPSDQDIGTQCLNASPIQFEHLPFALRASS